MANSPAVTAEQMRAHAEEFTSIERVGLRVWFDLDQAGHDVDADRFLHAWIQFEHFTSLLPSDPSQRTPEQLAIQMQLQLDANNELGVAQGILANDAKTRTKATQPFDIVPGVRDSGS